MKRFVLDGHVWTAEATLTPHDEVEGQPWYGVLFIRDDGTEVLAHVTVPFDTASDDDLRTALRQELTTNALQMDDEGGELADHGSEE